MSTPCLIARKKMDGTIDCIYCHNDGYLAHAGQILKHNYVTHHLIDKLFALGDLSSLGETPIEDPNGWSYDSRKWDNDLCTSYAARGDKGTEKRDNVKIAELENAAVDYVYLFKDSKWFYICTYYDPDWKEV